LAEELVVEDHVDYLAGVALTPNAVAVSSVSAAAKVPFFIANAATSNIFAKDPYTARFGVTEAQLVVPLAEWALRSGIKTAYIIVLDYGPGLDGGMTFSRTFTAGGGQIVGEVHIPVGNMDYSAYMQRIKDVNPQAIYAFVNADGGGPFLKAFHESGLAAKNVKVLTTEDMVLDDYLPSLGANALGVISAGNYSSTHDSRLNREFVADYEGHFHHAPPNFLSVAAYDCLNAIYLSVAALHGTAPPDKTMSVVRAMKFESPRGPLEIDPQTRDTIQNVYIRRTEMHNGVLQNTEFETIPMVKDPNEHYTTP
jgi:branched-chain amino acid transport system substrate-binding protein